MAPLRYRRNIGISASSSASKNKKRGLLKIVIVVAVLSLSMLPGFIAVVFYNPNRRNLDPIKTNQGGGEIQVESSLLRKEASPMMKRKLVVDLMEVSPIDCADVGFAFHPGLFVNTSTTGPRFEMNVHSPKKDTFVSRALANTGCFECDVMEAAMHALDAVEQNNGVLIDIGSNVGFYSLAAASRGHKAFAFEPFRINWERICRSVLHNSESGFQEKVTVFSKAATNQSTIVRFDSSQAKGNRGAMQVKATDSIEVEGSDDQEFEEALALLVEGKDYARGVTLDQMTEVLPTDRPIVLKVDVEGHECLALAGAMNFLRRVPEIAYVAIEWSHERLQTSCDNRQAIFDIFLANGLHPYMRVANEWKSLDPEQWQTWKQEGGHKPIVGLYDVAWSKEVPYNHIITS